MTSTLCGTLPLSKHLSSKAQSAFVLNELQTGTLISLAQLCDDDCIALFTKFDVKILKNDQVIIVGKRLENGLWSLPIESKLDSQANGILRTDKVKCELAEYLHGTLGGPVPSTLLRAIRQGQLTTFPGLTTSLISKHLSKKITTSLGHQDQESKNIRSTKTTLPQPAPPIPTLRRQLNLPLMQSTPSSWTTKLFPSPTRTKLDAFRYRPVAATTTCSFCIIKIQTPSMRYLSPIVKLPAFGMPGKTLTKSCSVRVIHRLCTYSTMSARKI
jgi:hypothetical protein